MKDYKYIRKHRRLLKMGRAFESRFGWLIAILQRIARILGWIGHKLRFLRVLRYLNPLRYIKRLDWYIIKKFLGYYFFSIALIISISIVFDFNENLAKFTEYHAPAKAIIFDYYANFIPYFANLFSALFVFVAVILFTSKLAGNSEIIAILASGVSFKRLLRPYLITCIMLSALSYALSAYVIPHGTVVRQNFETMYKNKKKNTSAENVQLQVDRGVIAYLQHYISDSKYHWKIRNWKVRQLKGMKEHITSGAQKDTLITMEPTDLVYSKGQQETFTSPELKEYISKQINRGSGNVVQYQVEYHKRIAASFASFILTIIGVSLSSRKRKGGMGLSLGIGLALSFGYIMLQTVSATFAIQANFPPALAAWLPNIIFAFVAYFCYRKAPR